MKKLFKKILASSVVSFAMVCATTSASAIPIDQYASSVVGFSSQYLWGAGSQFLAVQALGAPDAGLSYNSDPRAWTASTDQGTNEFLSLGFSTAVYATGATIVEKFNPGFVYQVDAIDMLGVLHTVWSGVDTSVAGVVNNFSVSWVQTSFLVQGLKIYVNNQPVGWKEIDAVMLSGQAVAVPLAGTLLLFGLGAMLLLVFRRRLI